MKSTLMNKWSAARIASIGRIASLNVSRQTRCITNVDVDGLRDRSKPYFSHEDSPYKLGKQRSNALELVEKQPVIEVDGEMAICDGGGGALGHPIEYISLAEPGVVGVCKYCALKYKTKAYDH